MQQMKINGLDCHVWKYANLSLDAVNVNFGFALIIMENETYIWKDSNAQLRFPLHGMQQAL